MKKEFLKMLEGFVNTDFNNVRAIVFLSTFKKDLMDQGYSENDAEKICLCLKLNINDNFDDELVEKTSKYYAQIIKKIDLVLTEKGFLFTVIDFLQSGSNTFGIDYT